MKGLRAEKGITLVALIITIIVMLILVGVTINLAVNGGLFEQAREGTERTKERIISEEITASLHLNKDGKINVYETYNEAKELLESEHKPVTLVEPAEVVETTDNVKIKVLDTYNYQITEEKIININ